MYIYIDESGSINNKLGSDPFVITLIYVKDKKKLKRAYKYFVSSNYDRLIALDADKIDPSTGQIKRAGGKMFLNNKFHELKGSEFDPDMKLKFADFFSQNHYFDIYYIKLDNQKASDNFCQSPNRAFNYLIRIALSYFITKGYLPNEDCHLQLDERNQKPAARCFLEDYLNTELTVSGTLSISFSTEYFDSANNKLIQIADVFSNLYYSHLKTGKYTDAIQLLKERDVLKSIFEFPGKT